MMDKPREECGLFGIYNCDGLDVAEETYLALYALQHRGQESAGIAVNDNGVIAFHKDSGLLPEVFDEKTLNDLGGGQIAVGHVRYAPSDKQERANAQPLVMRYVKGTLAICHNGALTNYGEIKKELEQGGSIFQTNCDAEVIAYVIAKERLYTGSIEKAVQNAMKKIKGAYSLVMMSPRKLIGVRDPNGFRPLSIGRLGNSYVLASETCALDSLGAQFVRDVRPGEVVVIDEEGIHSNTEQCQENTSLCIFEYVYFSRPDSVVEGVSVHIARQRAGMTLAKEHPVEADMVCGVPDSGLDAALGYALESGIPYGTALIKNKYIGRTFIQETQKKRERAVMIKLNALSAAVQGKRIVLIDDSIVRGTTCRHIVQMLRDAGAKEVHLRISSPPFLYPCYFGTDISSKNNLIANRLTLDGICQSIGADSLGYLSVEGIRGIAKEAKVGFCDACFTGNYPIEVPKGPQEDKFSQKIVPHKG
ncbi:MAG TPA: amidophosphoribosyltransferase [Candidatus Gallacutalibacter stercoravium]|nr:amidophosphoribosyltransferase [Candidatus Gallacutalibacter stercoravium]